MRIIQSQSPRPLNLLAIGPNALVAAASSTFGAPGDAEVWDVASGSRRFIHASVDEPTGLAFSSDGRFLFVADRFRLLVLDGTDRTNSKLGLGGAHTSVAFSEDGTRFLAAGPQASGLDAWSIITEPAYERSWGTGRHDFLWLWREEGARFAALAISRDCSRVAGEMRSEDAGGRPAHGISIRDASSGAQRQFIPLDPASPVQQLAFTADGSKLVARTDSRTVQLFDATTGAAAGELVHTGRPYVSGIAVHPRGPVACARTSGTVTFWDAEKREQLRTFDWKAGKLVSVAFGPDGALAAAGTEDGKVVVWDVDV
jgi:WD40 repeat protein